MSPLAAIGIAVISFRAGGFHLRAFEALPAVETALWAALACSVAIGRWGEIARGLALPSNALVIAIALLVPSIIVILVFLTRRPVEPRSSGPTPHRVATR